MLMFLSRINYFLILLYGIVLTFSICAIKKTVKNTVLCIVTFLCLAFLQFLVGLILGFNVTLILYPLIVHVPLILCLVLCYKQKTFLAINALMCAYVFTIPRKWIGTFIASLFGNSPTAYYSTLILITLPLAYIIIKYFTPSLRKILTSSHRISFLFTCCPTIFYISSYIISIYDRVLQSLPTHLLELIMSGTVLLYFIFTVLYCKELDHLHMAKESERLMRFKSNQSLAQLKKLQDAQFQTKLYRHDLRHHLQYIKLSIQQNNQQDALDYIETICTTLDTSQVHFYCENVTINLLLSHYISTAKEHHIACTVDTIIPESLPIPDTDLCCLFSNALENALHACLTLPTSEVVSLNVASHLSGSYLCVAITNTFQHPVLFEDSIPKSTAPEHGVGVQSIVAIVKKYGGIYSFSTHNHMFTLKFMLPFTKKE